MAILVTSKYEEDPIKIEGAREATTQNVDFSNTHGQITRQSEVGSGRNSNSFEMLWMSLSLPRIKKIQIKMKALEWPQHLTLIFHTVKGKLTLQSRVRIMIFQTLKGS